MYMYIYSLCLLSEWIDELNQFPPQRCVNVTFEANRLGFWRLRSVEDGISDWFFFFCCGCKCDPPARVLRRVAAVPGRRAAGLAAGEPGGERRLRRQPAGAGTTPIRRGHPQRARAAPGTPEAAGRGAGTSSILLHCFIRFSLMFQSLFIFLFLFFLPVAPRECGFRLFCGCWL